MDDDYKQKQMQLPDEDESPFSEPEDAPKTDDTDPQTDTNVDSDEAYQYGTSEAAHSDLPEPTDSDDEPLTNDKKIA